MSCLQSCLTTLATHVLEGTARGGLTFTASHGDTLRLARYCCVKLQAKFSDATAITLSYTQNAEDPACSIQLASNHAKSEVNKAVINIGL